MESSGKRPQPPPGFSPLDEHKRLKLSSVVESTNPFATSDVLDRVTKDDVAQKMQLLSPNYIAKYPKLVNPLLEEGYHPTRSDTGIYIDVQEEEEDGVDTKHDDLEHIWKEMAMAMECSKDVSENPLPDEGKEDDNCDHSFILKDDLGYVCRVCGIIDRGIETIFEFQYKVKRSTRTYTSDSWRNTKGKTDEDDDLIVNKISVHPRHMKQMKPHQVEGFNFLARNLAGDNPSGCIIAHAPGSAGKTTFMIISFMQSFMGKYPNAKPLVVLSERTLPTWKKEFQTWQVEDIPLYDFYNAKSRSEKLQVLKQWMEHKSVLFLAYKEFSSIVCDNDQTSRSVASLSCREILINVPSILVMLDDGVQNPESNQNKDMVQSLAKVQTSRKVVMSGTSTLYQNHTREVFDVLNLVRPKFLKTEASRQIMRRIQSRVHTPRVRSFYDLVENTLKKDAMDFRTKVAVIRDLREMTNEFLHCYKGDDDKLPDLVDFTVVLTLSARQKLEVEKLKKLGFGRNFIKTNSVGSAVYIHPELKPLAEIGGENCVSDNTMDDFIEKKLNMRDGVKAKFYYNMLNLCRSAKEKLLVLSRHHLTLKYLERLTVKLKGWSIGREVFSISGESNLEKRQWSVERFNNSPDAKVFFCSIDAAWGEGVSLVRASRVIILDPSVTRPAMDHAFGPGHTRKVFVYRLVAADSPEEEDLASCFKKEVISKMWFEWNEKHGGYGASFEEAETVAAEECGDHFLVSPVLGEDVKALYKR